MPTKKTAASVKAQNNAPVKKFSAITSKFADIDKTETELLAMHKTRNQQRVALGNLLLRRAKKVSRIEIDDESARLIGIAKAAIKADGYKVINDHEMKNTWSEVKAYLNQKIMAKYYPDFKVKVTAGKDSKGNPVIAEVPVKELPTTARTLATNASVVRKAAKPADSTDNRSKNGGKRKPRTPDTKKETRAPHSSMGDWTKSIGLAFTTVEGTKSVMTGFKEHYEKFVKQAPTFGMKITVEFTAPPKK